MEHPHHFRELFRLFRQRFVESDALAPDSDYNTNLWQILGVLAVPGLYASGILYGALLDQDTSPYAIWMLRGVRTFFCAYSFTVAGFATLFEWDMLFPERRDFLVLTLFPIRMRDLFLAKLASLGVLLGVLVATINAGALSVLALVLLMSTRAHNVAFVARVLEYVTSTTAAAVFGFLVVAGLQGLLINTMPVRVFRKISPYVQMAGMSALVLALVLFPLYINMFVVLAHEEWLWWFPPYWFAAMQELWGGTPGALLRAVGWHGVKAFGCALLIFAVTWAAGFMRHYRKTLESEDTTAGSLRGGRSWLERLLHTPQQRAVFYFSGSILARSAKHRLFLACYWSLGMAFGLVSGLGVDGGHLAFTAEGLRAFPFLMTFFAVSGFRAAFQFPAELASNWAFQIAEAGWGSAARYATRVRVLLSGLAPVVIFFTPFEIAHWGVRLGLLHVAIQAAAGVLLTEGFFWTFNKVPFTCSYFPGKMNLALLVAFYLYGFTMYSYTMADVEKWADTHVGGGLLILAAAAGLIRIAGRHRTGDWAVRFDGSEPEIVALDLS
jgi:hypothetical protein